MLNRFVRSGARLVGLRLSGAKSIYSLSTHGGDDRQVFCSTAMSESDGFDFQRRKIAWVIDGVTVEQHTYSSTTRTEVENLTALFADAD
jgi:hypothetical protein